MTPVELDALADKVAEKLRGPMISAAFPGWAGDWIRDLCKHGSYVWTYMLPMTRHERLPVLAGHIQAR